MHVYGGARHILRTKWERHGARVSGLSNILINTSLPERRGGRPARETQKAIPLSTPPFSFSFIVRTDVGWY